MKFRKSLNTNKVVSILLLILLCSCYFKQRKRAKVTEKEFKRVEICRKKWSYQYLKQKTTVQILLHDEKGSYDLSSWPNLFIGINEKNDTIGIIDINSEGKFDEGVYLTFDITEPNMLFNLNQPIFTIYRDIKKNNLYCSIDTLYYGQLLESQ